jgi:hypothetical protein
MLQNNKISNGVRRGLFSVIPEREEFAIIIVITEL